MKKKITLVWPYFFPQSGAASVRGVSFFNYLKNKYEVNVISVKRSQEPQNKKVVFLPLQLSLKPLFFIKDFIYIYKNINYKNPDLIIASLPSILIGIHSVMISKILKIKIILDLRDLEINKKNKIRDFLWKYCLNNATTILVTSNLQKNILVNAYKIKNKKIHLVPNGVSKELVISGRKEKKKIYDLIFLGTLVYERNLNEIIKLIKNLYESQSNLKIIFVGVDLKNKETKKFIDIISKEKFYNKIETVEEVSSEEAFNFVKKSKIGLVSLVNEEKYFYQIPTKIYEYFAAGLVTVALIPERAIEIKNIIDENSTGFYSNNPKFLAKNILKILSNNNKLKEYKKNSINSAIKYERSNSLKLLDEVI